MSWDNNLYSHPEKHGLVLVGAVDFSDGNYQFDYTAVWRDEAGNLYRADDSGCSCPSPFESYDDISDLTPTNLADLQAHLAERNANKSEWSANDDIDMDIANLLSRVAG